MGRKTSLMALILLFVGFGIGMGFDRNTKFEYGVTQEATVTKVVDGNTVELLFRNDLVGEVRTAKLKGVVASWKGDDGACFAENSKRFLNDLLNGTTVTVMWDSGDKVDSKGNPLVYLWLGKFLDINGLVVTTGNGWVARMFPGDRKEAYLAFEAKARAEKRGLWGSCSEEFLSKLTH
ncbi:MAG: thermonuclease family protein [Candidatus Niyogibacteria bacterium]|nr:thermonuclease family protein [Candidatus Niyogibacteria bacterium]